jgi:hypothetical protein
MKVRTRAPPAAGKVQPCGGAKVGSVESDCAPDVIPANARVTNALELSAFRRVARSATESLRSTSNPFASGSAIDVFRDARLPTRIPVDDGVLASDSAALLRAFFAERRGG